MGIRLDNEFTLFLERLKQYIFQGVHGLVPSGYPDVNARTSDLFHGGFYP